MSPRRHTTPICTCHGVLALSSPLHLHVLEFWLSKRDKYSGQTRQRLYRIKKEHVTSGDDLLSHRPASAVPSALAGLTTGFGMEPGVPPPPYHQKKRALLCFLRLYPNSNLQARSNKSDRAVVLSHMEFVFRVGRQISGQRASALCTYRVVSARQDKPLAVSTG